MLGTLLACMATFAGVGQPFVAWGKPVDGLQAGIRPAAAPQRVASGKVLEFEVVVRNIQERGSITLSIPEGTWYSGTAVKGVVALSPGSSAGGPVAADRPLNPGAEVVIGRVFLGLPGARPNAGYLIEVRAGKYRVGSEGVLPSPGGRAPELRTGYLDVELRAAE
jgi:hypothetical protein